MRIHHRWSPHRNRQLQPEWTDASNCQICGRIVIKLRKSFDSFVSQSPSSGIDSRVSSEHFFACWRVKSSQMTIYPIPLRNSWNGQTHMCFSPDDYSFELDSLDGSLSLERIPFNNTFWDMITTVSATWSPFENWFSMRIDPFVRHNPQHKWEVRLSLARWIRFPSTQTAFWVLWNQSLLSKLCQIFRYKPVTSISSLLSK
jgi:hypothetical protein